LWIIEINVALPGLSGGGLFYAENAYKLIPENPSISSGYDLIISN
jgi:hypothetical protein